MVNTKMGATQTRQLTLDTGRPWMYGGPGVHWASFQRSQSRPPGKNICLNQSLTIQVGTPGAILPELAGLISRNPCRTCVLPVTFTSGCLSQSWWEGNSRNPERQLCCGSVDSDSWSSSGLNNEPLPQWLQIKPSQHAACSTRLLSSPRLACQVEGVTLWYNPMLLWCFPAKPLLPPGLPAHPGLACDFETHPLPGIQPPVPACSFFFLPCLPFL